MLRFIHGGKLFKSDIQDCRKRKKICYTDSIAKQLETTAASVTDMVKRPAEKELINYEKYKGVTLTNAGNKVATSLIRKHRL